jgi:hypothetical protein
MATVQRISKNLFINIPGTKEHNNHHFIIPLNQNHYLAVYVSCVLKASTHALVINYTVFIISSNSDVTVPANVT